MNFGSDSQNYKVMKILEDGLPHRSDEITEKVFGTALTGRVGCWNIKARVCDVKKKTGWIFKKWPDTENPSLWWRQAIIIQDENMEIKSPAPEPLSIDEQIKRFRPVIGNFNHIDAVLCRRKYIESTDSDARAFWRDEFLKLVKPS